MSASPGWPKSWTLISDRPGAAVAARAGNRLRTIRNGWERFPRAEAYAHAVISPIPRPARLTRAGDPPNSGRTPTRRGLHRGRRRGDRGLGVRAGHCGRPRRLTLAPEWVRRWRRSPPPRPALVVVERACVSESFNTRGRRRELLTAVCWLARREQRQAPRSGAVRGDPTRASRS